MGGTRGVKSVVYLQHSYPCQLKEVVECTVRSIELVLEPPPMLAIGHPDSRPATTRRESPKMTAIGKRKADRIP